MLRPLPSRLTEEAEQDSDKEIYILALDGVTAHALAEATIAVLRGKLGHAFRPSPPEFRILCDKMMEPIYEKLTKDRREHALREQAKIAPPVLEPGWRERCIARLKSFYDENALLADAKPEPKAEPPTIHDYSREPLVVSPALLRSLGYHDKAEQRFERDFPDQEE